jgi:hypothetical protein
MRRPRIPSKFVPPSIVLAMTSRIKFQQRGFAPRPQPTCGALKDRQIAGISTLSLHHPFVFFIEDF